MVRITVSFSWESGSIARTTWPIAGKVLSVDRPLVHILLYVMMVWEVFIGTGSSVDISTVPLRSRRAVGVLMTVKP